LEVVVGVAVKAAWPTAVGRSPPFICAALMMSAAVILGNMTVVYELPRHGGAGAPGRFNLGQHSLAYNLDHWRRILVLS